MSPDETTGLRHCPKHPKFASVSIILANGKGIPIAYSVLSAPTGNDEVL